MLDKIVIAAIRLHEQAEGGVWSRRDPRFRIWSTEESFRWLDSEFDKLPEPWHKQANHNGGNR